MPNPGPREVLIRTSVAGLCHSDLHFMEGLYPHPLPAVLGHESAGAWAPAAAPTTATTQNAMDAKRAWFDKRTMSGFDKLTMSARPEPVEGRALR